MSEILAGWRRDALERGTYESEARKREIDAEHERKARVAAEKQQAVATNWYAAIDERVHEHLQNWLWEAIDERVVQLLELHFFSGDAGVGGAVKGGIFDAIVELRARLRDELRSQFKHALQETVDVVGREIAALERRLASNNQTTLVSWIEDRIKATLAHARDEHKRALEELQ